MLSCAWMSGTCGDKGFDHVRPARYPRHMKRSVALSV